MFHVKHSKKIIAVVVTAFTIIGTLAVTASAQVQVGEREEYYYSYQDIEQMNFVRNAKTDEIITTTIPDVMNGWNKRGFYNETDEYYTGTQDWGIKIQQSFWLEQNQSPILLLYNMNPIRTASIDTGSGSLTVPPVDYIEVSYEEFIPQTNQAVDAYFIASSYEVRVTWRYNVTRMENGTLTTTPYGVQENYTPGNLGVWIPSFPNVNEWTADRPVGSSPIENGEGIYNTNIGELITDLEIRIQPAANLGGVDNQVQMLNIHKAYVGEDYIDELEMTIDEWAKLNVKETTVQVDFTTWLTNSVWAFMNFEIYPGLKLYYVLGFIIAIAVMKIFLKMFAGG